MLMAKGPQKCRQFWTIELKCTFQCISLEKRVLDTKVHPSTEAMLPWKECRHRSLYGHVAMETIAEPVVIEILLSIIIQLNLHYRKLRLQELSSGL